MSDTPRTDAEVARTARVGAMSGMEQAWEDVCHFARELERELRKLAAEYADLKVYGMGFPTAWGVSRLADNPQAVMVSFKVAPTDDELRTFHDWLAGRWAP